MLSGPEGGKLLNFQYRGPGARAVRAGCGGAAGWQWGKGGGGSLASSDPSQRPAAGAWRRGESAHFSRGCSPSSENAGGSAVAGGGQAGSRL